jgi:flavin reductase (DIM6/NTAB) family NADH-FMN oxidoreductase RutF
MKEVSLQEAYDDFKPENIVFVISIDTNDKPSGMVAAWHMRCSSEPPLYAVSLSKKGYTQSLIKNSKEFMVVVPNKDMEKYIKVFGSSHGDKVDKFSETKVPTQKAKNIKSPLIKEATINLECKLEKEIDCGDHYIFIGLVLAAHQNKEKGILLNMKKIDGNRVFKEFKDIILTD